VELAVKNIERNKIKNAEAYVSDGFQKVDGLFNAIVTSIPPLPLAAQIVMKK